MQVAKLLADAVPGCKELALYTSVTLFRFDWAVYDISYRNRNGPQLPQPGH